MRIYRTSNKASKMKCFIMSVKCEFDIILILIGAVSTLPLPRGRVIWNRCSVTWHWFNVLPQFYILDFGLGINFCIFVFYTLQLFWLLFYYQYTEFNVIKKHTSVFKTLQLEERTFYHWLFACTQHIIRKLNADCIFCISTNLGYKTNKKLHLNRNYINTINFQT